MQIVWGEIYINKESGKRCKPIYPCKVKVDGQWAEGVVYHAEDVGNRWYLREEKEFSDLYHKEEINERNTKGVC